MGRTRVIVAAAAVLFGVVLLATPSLAGPCSDVAGVYNFRWINFSPSCTRIYDHGSRFTIRADCSWDNIEGPEGYCKGTYNPTKGTWITTECVHYGIWYRAFGWTERDTKVYAASGYAKPGVYTWNIEWTSPQGGSCKFTQITSHGRVPLPATIGKAPKHPSTAAISQGPKHPKVYPSSNAKGRYDQCLKGAFAAELSLKVAAQVGFAKALTKVLPVGSKLYAILTKNPVIPTNKAALINWLQSKGITLGPNAVVGDAVEDIFLLALRQQWREYCTCVWLDNKPAKEGCSSKSYSPVVFDGYMVYACRTLGASKCSDADKKAAADSFCRKKGHGPAAKYNIKFINVPYSIVPATGAFCDKDVTCSHEAFGWISCT